jgi:hypothetical protein
MPSRLTNLPEEFAAATAATAASFRPSGRNLYAASETKESECASRLFYPDALPSLP